MIRRLLQRQTLASFDYQWRELTEGGALLTDTWFLKNVDRIISEELLCLKREWFIGKRVLDAGSGNGRWTIGLLRLGCHVTAVDASAHALERLDQGVSALEPDARDRLTTRVVDLLEPPADLDTVPFDLVFSFGVLHHTGDTHRALQNVTGLVGPAGVLFLYLYGRHSFSAPGRAMLELRRLALAPLPFEVKRRLLAARGGVDVHQAFDELSPVINARHDYAEVERWLREDGFSAVERTIDHSELFVRALRHPQDVEGFETPHPHHPYWFERYGTAAKHKPDGDG